MLTKKYCEERMIFYKSLILQQNTNFKENDIVYFLESYAFYSHFLKTYFDEDGHVPKM